MRFLPLVCVAVLVASAGAQQALGLGAIAGSFGVSNDHGRPMAGGPRYSVTFRADGPIYTPLFGAVARAECTVSPTLQFTFVEARVGTTVLASGGAVAPQIDGERVEYDRGVVTERYEARLEGIEQSFVLSARPATSGDFTVRGRITTALPLVAAGDDGLRFELPSGGGVSLGTVTGVDAVGATVRGGLSLRGDELELTLPASFVASATYPIVLDPLVGTVFTIGDDPLHDDVHPAIAFDATTGRYLVVWAVDVPASGTTSAHSEIRGQFVVLGGGTVGTQLLLDALTFDGARPQVANVNLTNRFLVVWKGTIGLFSTGIVGRAVAASNGAMSNVVMLAGNSLARVVDDAFALGGDSRTGLLVGSHVLLAFRDWPPTANPLPSSNAIRAMRVQLPSSGDPVPATEVQVASSANLLDQVAVTAHAGSQGRWVVVFGQSVTAMAGPMQRILGQIVDIGGALCGVPFTLVNNGAAGDVDQPVVATRDGSEFVFGWHDAVASRIQLRRGVVAGSCGSSSWTFGGFVDPLQMPGPAHSPVLAFAKDKYLLAWQQFGSGWRVFTKGLDPATCGSCGVEQRVDQPVVVDGLPAVGSPWQGGDTSSDYALVAWCEAGAVKARHWTVHGTLGVVDMGGGCGVTVFTDVASYIGQPQLGDSTFQVSLTNPTAPTLALVVGFSAGNLVCGPCTLVPSLDVLLPAAIPTAIPIPCDANLIGAELFTQWVQLRQVGCTLLPDLGLSNGLKFTIAE